MDNIKFPAWRKWFFGAGDTAGSVSHTIIAFFFMFYLTDVVGLRPVLAGSAVLIGKIWDAVSDPLVGYFSDNTRSRFGRRRVYLLYCALPLGVSFFFLWALPHNSPEMLTFALASLAYIFHMTFLTAVMVPYQALLPEMVSDYDERTSFTAYRMLFSILCGLIAVAVPDIIVNGSPTKSQGFIIMSIIFSIVISIAPLFPFFGCYEKKKVHKKAKFGGFKNYVKPIINNVPFRMATLIYFFTWAAISLVETMFMYFFTYWLGREDLFYMVVAVLFISAALFLPAWVKLSQKLEKKTAYLIGISELSLCLFVLIFINPSTPVWFLFIYVVFISFGVSAAHVLPHTLIPDCIDYGKYISKQENEGIYYGLITFFYKLGVAVVLWLSGLVLELSGYMNPETAETVIQPETALTAIRIMQGPLPAAILIVGIILIMLYPISRNKHKAIIRRIEKRNGEF